MPIPVSDDEVMTDTSVRPSSVLAPEGPAVQDARNSVDLEVFCNRGRPTLAKLERNTLGDD